LDQKHNICHSSKFPYTNHSAKPSVFSGRGSKFWALFSSRHG